VSRRRTPIIEVFATIALIIAGMLAYVYYSRQARDIDTAAALRIAKEHVERGQTLVSLIDHDNPGAPITWSVIGTSDSGLVRVGARATRTNGESEYRFDVDTEAGRVHAANPLAIELIEVPSATE
jgi:hypothetical protein